MYGKSDIKELFDKQVKRCRALMRKEKLGGKKGSLNREIRYELMQVSTLYRAMNDADRASAGVSPDLLPASEGKAPIHVGTINILKVAQALEREEGGEELATIIEGSNSDGGGSPLAITVDPSGKKAARGSKKKPRDKKTAPSRNLP
ncbi:unnamed protein product [marine sediment metagenome]|uniref:Uncharacterized protein n=1 Tax=marine sediment metagenome TaxID=412755 RepID=X1C9M3_9ZZZZ